MIKKIATLATLFLMVFTISKAEASLLDFITSSRNRIVIGSSQGFGIIITALDSFFTAGQPQKAIQIQDEDGESKLQISTFGAIGFGTGSNAFGTLGECAKSGGGSGELMSFGSCGSAGSFSTGNVLTIFGTDGDPRWVNVAGDTMTGALTVQATISGASLVVSDLKNCDTIDTDANGVFSCGTDDSSGGGALTGTGAATQLAFYTAPTTLSGASNTEWINATNTLEITGTYSGTNVHAQDLLTSSGNLVVTGNMSGTTLYWQNQATGAHLDLFGKNPTVRHLTVTAAPSQTAEIFTVFDENGVEVFDVHENGETDITFVATENTERALGVEVDSAGFADVKAIDIDYDANTLAVNEAQAIFSINLDRSDTTGGDIILVGCSATEGGATAYCLEINPELNVLIQHVGVFEDMDIATLTGSTNVLAAFISTSENRAIFPNNNDTLEIADAQTFDQVEFLLDTEASNPGTKSTFEYSLGVASWQTFNPIDGTEGMRNTGIISWEVDDLSPPWATATGSDFYFRITRTQANLTTDPIERLVQIVAGGVDYTWDFNGDVFIRNLSGSKLSITGNMSGGSLTVDNLLGCDTIDTDSSGVLSCGTDANTDWSNTGSLQAGFDLRYVEISGDTMTGGLIIDVTGGDINTLGLSIINTASGTHIHAEQSLTSSGTLTVDGTMSGQVINISGLKSCDTIDTDGDGLFSCGTDENTDWSNTGSLQTAFDLRYVNQSGDTMTGSLIIDNEGAEPSLNVKGTASGDILHAQSEITSSGTLIVDGSMSGQTLTISTLKSCDTIDTDANGLLACGTDDGGGLTQADADARYVNQSGDTMTGALTINNEGSEPSLNVKGTASGDIIHAQIELTSSGTLIVETSISGATLVISDLSACDTIDTDSSGSLSCGTDQDTTYTAGQGLTLTSLVFSVNASLSGTLLDFTTVSGGTIRAQDLLTSSGNLIVDGSMSGQTLTVSTLKSCDTIDTDANGLMSCGTDENTDWSNTGSLQTAFDDRYVNQSGDTMTGSLTIDVTSGDINTIGLAIVNTASGANIHAEQTLTSSGTLTIDGAMSGQTLTVSTLKDCDTIDTDANGLMSCGTDDGGSGSPGGSTQQIQYNNNGVFAGDANNTWNSGSTTLNVIGTVSGTILHAELELTSSGTLIVDGSMSGRTLLVSTLKNCDTIDTDSNGLMSCGVDANTDWSNTGSLQTAFDDRYVNQSGDTMTGTLTINNEGSEPSLNVKGTASGDIIHAQIELTSSGTLIVDGSMSGLTLTVSGNSSLAIITSGTWNGDLIDIGTFTNLTAGRSLTLTDDDVAADAELFTDSNGFYVEDPIVESFDDTWFFMNAVTITRVFCKTDTGTVDLNIENASDANVLSAELVCDVGGQDSCASGCDVDTINLSNDNFAQFTDGNTDLSATSGVPNSVSIFIGFTKDD